jgi:cytochrome c
LPAPRAVNGAVRAGYNPAIFGKGDEMKNILMMLAAAAILAAGSVHAQSGADVLKAKGCLNCHDVDKKKVGPAFKEVAAKYKGDKGAEGKLIEKIKAGKTHPPVAASDAELKAAVGYVLSTK